ncbi:MAG: TonB-dependent receptor [Neisseriaceae bacterium]|nr:TonB-dependent receptor [Neisseriaceae bacterium]
MPTKTHLPKPATIHVLLALSVLSSTALANQAAAPEETGEFQLGTITVYGQAKDPAVVLEQKIDKKTIQTVEAKDVGQALAHLPGVQWHAASGRRHESSVSVRGYGSGDVPIYIDGVPAYVPYDGMMDLSRFRTEDVASIKLAKGYSSVIYGPNAYGGVINVVSRKPSKAFEADVMIGAFTGKGYESSINLGTLQEKWYAQLSTAYAEHDYTRAAAKFHGVDEGDGYKDPADQTVKHTDRKSMMARDKKVSFKLGFTPNETDEYVLSYLKQEGRQGPKDTDKGFVPTTFSWPVWDRETVSLVSHTQLGQDSYVKPRFYYDQYSNALVGFLGKKAGAGAKPSPNASRYDDYAWGGSVELGTKLLPNNTLKALVYYKFDHHGSFDTIGLSNTKIDGTQQTVEQKTWSFALEDTHQFNEQWEAQLGLAYSKRKMGKIEQGDNRYNQIFEQAHPNRKDWLSPDIDTLDPQLAIFYKPTEFDRFYYNIAKKTKFPTIKQQFSGFGGDKLICPGNAKKCGGGEKVPLIILQNPDLKPETAIHQEVGYVGQPLPGMNLQASVYYSRTKNHIERSDTDFSSYPGYGVEQTVNTEGRVVRKGFDLGVDYEFNDRLTAGLSYAYLSMKDKDDSSHYFRDIAKHTGAAYAVLTPMDGVKVMPTVRFYSSSAADTENKNRNGGAAIADLKLSVTPKAYKNLTWSVGSTNVFNKNYATYEDAYPSEGRSYYTNVRMTF